MDESFSPADLVAAHEHALLHRDEVLASDSCACYYCQRHFSPSSIIAWTDGGLTALCPHCGINAVLGSACGYALTPAFLRQMHDFLFEIVFYPYVF